jgi:hypothetical protein
VSRRPGFPPADTRPGLWRAVPVPYPAPRMSRLGRLTPLLALLTGALSGCLDDYDPPPELASINVAQGLYDPETGPLEVKLSEAVDVDTLVVTLFLGRTDKELDLCLAAEGPLPAGCAEEARPVVGPCPVVFANGRRDEDDPTTLRFACEGGTLVLPKENDRFQLETAQPLVPYERYVLRLESGLADVTGRARRTPLDVPFQVRSAVPCGPTGIESGFFFAVFDIEQPIAAQFHFVFWVQVKQETGEVRLYGADIDPKDTSIDSKVNRDFATSWIVDPHPPTGATILASGQLANIDGADVLVVFPFTLAVAVPRVEAPGTELQGRFLRRAVAGAPGGEREVIEGRLNGPAVFLGDGADRAAIGPGRGQALLFRLTPEEVPELAELLPMGVTVQDVAAPFGECE